MYRHPTVQYAELGLGGKWGRLVVWLFGIEWTTPQISLQLSQWYSLCLTWSHTNNKPALYVNGKPMAVTPAYYTDTSFTSPSCCKLSPNGSLTLGAGHTLIQGEIQIIPFSTMLGKISLFRIWGRERSKQELTSLYCTEGDLVKWERDHWDTWSCDPLTDSSLQCEWSIYKVRLLFAIIRHDKNTTELYIARDIAHHWVKLTNVKFYCLVHINVIPSLNVATVQEETYIDLTIPYYHPSGLLQLLADTSSIHTTPVESFPEATTSPPGVEIATSLVSNPTFTTTITPSSFSPITTFNTPNTSMKTSTSVATATTFTTTPANVSELYFEVKVNVSITGECDPQEILPIWVCLTKQLNRSQFKLYVS
ncbi:uncharacterized protein LOC121654619 [Melanotaenia boesemani]|uniref:uncharacterized protein LOC121654619 n=1 Tax=Melanotaenia boesemani TaxID=1250792 RepID=UPI001C043F5A|nr:uncharacterized protein LOC121654619 [Melanotaenia boesemani]